MHVRILPCKFPLKWWWHFINASSCLEKVLKDENGPLGQVSDYWWRTEYQQPGALHIHMVVWWETATIPENAVIAKLPVVRMLMTSLGRLVVRTSRNFTFTAPVFEREVSKVLVERSLIMAGIVFFLTPDRLTYLRRVACECCIGGVRRQRSGSIQLTHLAVDGRPCRHPTSDIWWLGVVPC